MMPSELNPSQTPEIKPPPARRILAVVLPDLLCELGVQSVVAPLGLAAEAGPSKSPTVDPGKSASKSIPFGVVLVERKVVREGRDEASGVRAVEVSEIPPTARLLAVNDVARRAGVREGQSIAEARAVLSQLRVREVTRAQLLDALGRVAEVAMAFGVTVAIEPPSPASQLGQVPDTVWVDISGVAHLFGGEDQLVAELCAGIRSLGHLVRSAVATGPLLAQALARWDGQRPLSSGGTDKVRTARETQARISALPVNALPVGDDEVTWLTRLGVLSFGELAALPRSAALPRLGVHAALLLELCEGRDPLPLVAWTPPRVLVEEVHFEEGVPGLSPLRFVLRGLCSRVSARLSGRGEAAQVLVLTVLCDRSVAELRGVEATQCLRFELSSPLWRDEELQRVILSRLERTALGAPSIGLRVEVPVITAALTQLNLSRVAGGRFNGSKGVESLPVLLAELTADIGKERVGVLKCGDAHRPEARSKLALKGLDLAVRRGNSGSGNSGSSGPVKTTPHRSVMGGGAPGATPSRLLPKPLPLSAALRVGASLVIEEDAYTIESMVFMERLEQVEWWMTPTSRDYFRLGLRGPRGILEVLVYLDRESNARFLQGLYD